MSEAQNHVIRATAIGDITNERRRQIEEEGWTPDHDDAHRNGEMADAAACYAVSRNIEQHRVSYHGDSGHPLWPWAPKWWKPKDRRADLVRAAALIIAEIERLDRQAGQ